MIAKKNTSFGEIELPWSNYKTFYLAHEHWQEPYILNKKESHHLLHVLRIQIGTEIHVLDGRGREGLFSVKEVIKDRVSLSYINDWMHPEPTRKVVLAAGWTKAARRGWLFEKAAELEAWAIWFWKAERSQFPLSEAKKESWQGQIIAGAKQCNNPWFPSLQLFPNGIEELIYNVDTIGCDFRHVLVENTCGPAQPLTLDMLKQPGLTICVLGPEGGFTHKEILKLKEASFLSLTLGDRVLRWETAAILCLGLHWWKKVYS